MNNKIQEKLDNSYLFGCVKYKNEYSFYLMPIAYWILNYSKYDPGYNPNDWEDGIIFRDNILNVEDDNIARFIRAIQVDKIDVNILNANDYNFKDIFLFFIDFDSKLFVSNFDDISVEEYLPDETWTGKFDEPSKYLPKELALVVSRS